MQVAQILATVAAVHLAATAVPGPTSLVVIRTALTRSRRASAGAAAGIMVADACWAVAAMAGISLVFARWPWLYRALGVVGGGYLLYLAVRTWRSARRTVTDGPELTTSRSAFATGPLTNLTNPKSVVFFGSIFAAVLPPNVPPAVLVAVIAVVAVDALGWHLALAYVFSLPRLRQLYGPLEPVIDRIAAALMGGLGALLINEARTAE